MEAGAAERERLRRALYREGATEADRDRYAQAAPLEEPVPPDAAATPRRQRLAAPVAVLAVAAVGLLALPVVAGPAPAETRAVPSSSTVPARSAPPADARLVSVTFTDAGVVQAFHGTGTATVRLDDGVMPHDGGRLSVVLAPSDTALIGWRVWRSFPAEGVADQLLAARSVTERRGVAVPIVFPFTGRPPTTVAVQAPAGIAWSLVVTSLRGATAR